VNEYILFERTLKRDIDRGDYIEDSLAGRNLFISIGSERIGYLIDTTHICRIKGGITDTFFIKGRMDSIEYFNDSLRLVTDFRLVIGLNKEDLALSFSKIYSVRELMRAESKLNE
jgi:hypothetical protein